MAKTTKKVHIDSLNIENFKIFKKLTFKKLGRVNLFVGKNNIGKTCLLEAIESYAKKFENIFDLVEDRDADWEILSKTEDAEIENPLFSIFNDYDITKTVKIAQNSNNGKNKDILELLYDQGENNAKKRFEIVKKILKEKTLDKDSINRVLDDENSLDFKEFVRSKAKELSGFIIFLNATYIKTIYDKDNYFNNKNSFLPKKISSPEKDFLVKNIQKVSTQNKTSKTISSLWNNIDGLSDLENYVIEGLKLIEPKIQKIRLLDNIKQLNSSFFNRQQEEKRSEKIAVVICEDNPRKRLPLKTFGDGITRIFYIILALVNAENGILIIDEVENGLHWSIFPKLWEVIFVLSEKLNVQVFATTHSSDCVRGFSKIWNEKETEGTFYRLQKRKDSNIVTVDYDPETLITSLDSDIEFR